MNLRTWWLGAFLCCASSGLTRAIAATPRPASAFRTTPAAASLRVRVIVGNPDTGSFAPASGAMVTLTRSSDVTSLWSASSDIRTCDASGLASFDDPPATFTITAQYDFSPPGAPSEVYRFATTLVDLSPQSDSITVPVFVGDEDPDLVLDATLSGTVTRIPPLGPGEYLAVEVSCRDGGPDYNRGTTVQIDAVHPSLGTYDVPVPSGYVVDVVLTRRRASGPRMAQIELNHFMGNGVNVLDLRYGRGRVIPFASQRADFLNVPAGPGAHEVFVSLRGSQGQDVEISLHSSSWGMPSTISVPPLPSQVSYYGLEPWITCEFWDWVNEDGGSASETLAATDFEFDLLGLPSLQGLVGLFSPPEALSPTFSASPAPGASTWPAGLELVWLESDSPGIPGLTGCQWEIFAAALSGSFASARLPRTARPMIGAYADVTCGGDSLRFDEPIAFDTFFDANLEANLAALAAAVDVESEAGVHAKLATLGCDVELFKPLGPQGVGGDVPVRLLKFQEVSGPLNSGVVASRWTQGSEQDVLDCAVSSLNAFYAPQTGVTFRADGVQLVSVTLDDLTPDGVAPVTGGAAGAQDDSVLSREELRNLRDHLVKRDVVVPPGCILIAPVHALSTSQGIQLGVVLSPPHVGEALSASCGEATLEAHEIDNLVFLHDLGDGQTIAHEVGHCFGLGHCTDLASLMSKDRGYASTGATCSTPVRVGSQLSDAQIQRIQEFACEYTVLLAPYPLH